VLDRSFVVEVADQGIARISRYGNDAAAFKQLHSLFEQTGLGVVGVNLKKLSHERVRREVSGCGA
jgi:hypothetical protein